MYTAEAQKLGISLEECSHKVKEFSLTALPGDYRRLLVKPKGMLWQLLLYSHPDQDLAYTDLDAVLGNPKPELETLSPGTPFRRISGRLEGFELTQSLDMRVTNFAQYSEYRLEGHCACACVFVWDRGGGHQTSWSVILLR